MAANKSSGGRKSISRTDKLSLANRLKIPLGYSYGTATLLASGLSGGQDFLGRTTAAVTAAGRRLRTRRSIASFHTRKSMKVSNIPPPETQVLHPRGGPGREGGDQRPYSGSNNTTTGSHRHLI